MKRASSGDPCRSSGPPAPVTVSSPGASSRSAARAASRSCVSVCSARVVADPELDSLEAGEFAVAAGHQRFPVMAVQPVLEESCGNRQMQCRAGHRLRLDTAEPATEDVFPKSRAQLRSDVGPMVLQTLLLFVWIFRVHFSCPASVRCPVPSAAASRARIRAPGSTPASPVAGTPLRRTLSANPAPTGGRRLSSRSPSRDAQQCRDGLRNRPRRCGTGDTRMPPSPAQLRGSGCPNGR